MPNVFALNSGHLKLWTPNFSVYNRKVQMTCIRGTHNITVTYKEETTGASEAMGFWSSSLRFCPHCIRGHWRIWFCQTLISGQFHVHIHKRDLNRDVLWQLLEKYCCLLQIQRWISPRDQPLLETLYFGIHKWCYYKFLFHQRSNPLWHKLRVFTTTARATGVP